MVAALFISSSSRGYFKSRLVLAARLHYGRCGGHRVISTHLPCHSSSRRHRCAAQFYRTLLEQEAGAVCHGAPLFSCGGVVLALYSPGGRRRPRSRDPISSTVICGRDLDAAIGRAAGWAGFRQTGDGGSHGLIVRGRGANVRSTCTTRSATRSASSTSRRCSRATAGDRRAALTAPHLLARMCKSRRVVSAHSSAQGVARHACAFQQSQ